MYPTIVIYGTLVKNDISRVLFPFFKILIFQVASGIKGRSKMTKTSVCCAPYLSNHISHNLHLWYTCAK